jgi:formylglycine-generating enzyme required for sulfatase activity
VTVASVGAALAFSEKEQEAIRQQEQIRLAAADMGLFELILESFDWDPERQVPTPPESPSPLEWQLHAVDANDPRVQGRAYTATDVHRGERRIEGRAVHEQVEARSGQAFLKVMARGGDCAPTWVYLKHLPGYIDRTAEIRPVIRVPVPTCQASRAGMVEIPEGEFFRNVDGPKEGGDTIDERVYLPRFAIDRTEVTRAQFNRYSKLEPLSGDGAAPAPHLNVDRPDAGRLPIVGVNFFTARNYCRFMGKELPSIEQWQKTLRGGVKVGGAENPAPKRNTPWVTTTRDPPANFVESESSDLAPVGSYPDDTSPYGVVDLAGNVSEWSADSAAPARLRGLRVMLGGNWDSPPHLRDHSITWRNTHPDRYLDFAIGFRCVTGPVSR